MTKEIINGIDVSESVSSATNNDVYYSQKAVDELLNNIKRLQKENEELKAENKNYAKLMLEQQEISQKYWECIGKIKQAIEVLAETCNVYPLKTNLDKLITTFNEVLNDRD